MGEPMSTAVLEAAQTAPTPPLFAPNVSRARMADSTRPALIPDSFRLRPNGVAAYVDGEYAWPLETQDSYPRIWRICVTGALAMAPHARVLDVERFDATPADVEPYREARAARAENCIVYCDRSTVAQVVRACPSTWHLLEWWIATLDGGAWTPAAIVRWLDANSGELGPAPIDPARIRAIQNVGMGAYDVSLMFGDPRWTYQHAAILSA